jgi:bifunctional DNA-binding transcriptional regulator/antitoxin component of YhaV-PrlF toxin-antitoxin module
VPELQVLLPEARLMASCVRLRVKAQVTIPENIMKALGIGEGDVLEFEDNGDGTATVRGMIMVPAVMVPALPRQEQEA